MDPKAAARVGAGMPGPTKERGNRPGIDDGRSAEATGDMFIHHYWADISIRGA